MLLVEGSTVHLILNLILSYLLCVFLFVCKFWHVTAKNYEPVILQIDVDKDLTMGKNTILSQVSFLQHVSDNYLSALYCEIMHGSLGSVVNKHLTLRAEQSWLLSSGYFQLNKDMVFQNKFARGAREEIYLFPSCSLSSGNS